MPTKKKQEKICENPDCSNKIEEDATWSAGSFCDHYCSKECCNKAYYNMPIHNEENPYKCPCY